MTEKKIVTRETVKIGLDFRPIPIDLGDGTEWVFNPDPNPTEWGVLTDAMSAFGSLVATDGEPDLTSLPQLASNLSDAIAGLLVDTGQAEAFVARGYGVVAMQKLAVALLEASGFPTQPPSDSGTP